MTDIVEEARAMLAESTKYSIHPWTVRGLVHTIVCDARHLDVAEAATSEDAALIAAAPRLLAAIADECERLRAENARLREAMPTEEEWAHMQEARAEDKLNAECPDHIASNRIIDQWLARLDVTKGVR